MLETLPNWHTIPDLVQLHSMNRECVFNFLIKSKILFVGALVLAFSLSIALADLVAIWKPKYFHQRLSAREASIQASIRMNLFHSVVSI